MYHSGFIMAKRGREFERGLRPLSLKLPSPANMNTGFTMFQAGEGIQG
jgi:hypothetical protein